MRRPDPVLRSVGLEPAHLWQACLHAAERNKPLIKLLLGTVLLAWLLTRTSSSCWGNLPSAALVLLVVRWLLVQAAAAQQLPLRSPGSRPRRRDAAGEDADPRAVQFAAALAGGQGLSYTRPDRWRDSVRSPVVEHAWEALCSSIVQEFIYDTWYAALTPDKEFPADVRRLLNHVFGQLASRSRRLDLRAVLNDASELFMETLELFRDTRDSILAAHGPTALIDMTPAARERAFRQEMRAEKNLHPALQTPEGHYRFLKAVSEGLVLHLLEGSELQRTSTRVVCRELLAGVVLRPLMMWCTPYYANKALYAALRSKEGSKPAQPPHEGSPNVMAAVRSQQMRGNFEFEQRARKSAAAEESVLLDARMARARLHTRKPSLARASPHGRSRSADATADRAQGLAEAFPDKPAAAATSITAAGQSWAYQGLQGAVAATMSVAQVSPFAAVAAAVASMGSEGSVKQRRATTLPAPATAPVPSTQAAAAAAAEQRSGIVSPGGGFHSVHRGQASLPAEPQQHQQQWPGGSAYMQEANHTSHSFPVPVPSVNSSAPSTDSPTWLRHGASAAVHAPGHGSSGSGSGLFRKTDSHVYNRQHHHHHQQPSAQDSRDSIASCCSLTEQDSFYSLPDTASILLSSSPLSLPLPPERLAPIRTSSHAADMSISRVAVAASVPVPAKGGAGRPPFSPAAAAVDTDLREWEHVLVAGPSAAAWQPAQRAMSTPHMASSWHPPDSAATTAAVSHRGMPTEAVGKLATAGSGDHGAAWFSGHLVAGAADSTKLESSLAALSTSSVEGDRLRAGFVGRPKAKVVAADLNSTGSKDYVVYRVRVADDVDEWTVSRRYRNFETLHKQLKSLPGYRLKLPPKRIFTHTQSVDFVEERRVALDKYLQAALAHDMLAASIDMWEFLRANCELYELQPSSGFFRGLGGAKSGDFVRRRRSILSVSYLATSGGGSEAAGTRAQAVEASVRTAQDRWASFTLGRRQQSVSVPHDLNLIGGPAGAAAAASSATESSFQVRGPVSTLSTDLGSPGLSTATSQAAELSPESRLGAGRLGGSSSAGGRDNAPRSGQASPGAGDSENGGGASPLSRRPGSRQGAASVAPAEAAPGGSRRFRGLSRRSKSPKKQQAAEAAAEPLEGAGLGQAGATGGAATVQASGKSLTGRAGSMAAGLLSRATKKAIKGSSGSMDKLVSRPSSPLPAERGPGGTAGPGEGDSNSDSPSKRGFFRRGPKSKPGTPVKDRPAGKVELSRRKRLDGSSGGEATAPTAVLATTFAESPRHASLDTAAGGGGAAAAGAAASAGQAFPDSEASSCQELEDSAGISAPLYDIVDCVFQLQTRGFFRRQVFSVARQVLSLVAGDTIDVYLLSRLRLLRQAHTIARVIQSIQGSLWPGGTWFQYLPQYQQPPRAATRPASASLDAEAGVQAAARPVWAMQADKYLEPGGPPPLDEDEIREAVYELMLTRVPTALVRLLGRGAYVSGMEDLFGMLQSPTFVLQLGYGLLSIAVVHLFPELKPAIRRMEREGVL
ncbi:hypothetical protein N2152v2_004986 [Parachlorella kessleri]